MLGAFLGQPAIVGPRAAERFAQARVDRHVGIGDRVARGLLADLETGLEMVHGDRPRGAHGGTKQGVVVGQVLAHRPAMVMPSMRKVGASAP